MTRQLRRPLTTHSIPELLATHSLSKLSRVNLLMLLTVPQRAVLPIHQLLLPIRHPPLVHPQRPHPSSPIPLTITMSMSIRRNHTNAPVITYINRRRP